MVVNAVNAPSVAPEEMAKLGPYLTLAEQIGSFAGQITDDRIRAVTVAYEGQASALDFAAAHGGRAAGAARPAARQRQHGERPLSRPRAGHRVCARSGARRRRTTRPSCGSRCSPARRRKGWRAPSSAAARRRDRGDREHQDRGGARPAHALLHERGQAGADRRGSPRSSARPASTSPPSISGAGSRAAMRWGWSGSIRRSRTRCSAGSTSARPSSGSRA